jgi:hypothetical protein
VQTPHRTLAGDLAAMWDPVIFARRADIVPDPWQATVLRSSAQQQILLCSRQAGKSTVSAVLAVHEALYQAGSLILVLNPSLRQSQELFRKMLDTYAGVGETVKAETENKLTLELSNGSRIVSLPGKEATIRGFSGVSLLLVDEASRVDDALYQAVRPMLAVSRGRIVLLSTPFGKRGFFFHEWMEGGPDWQRTRITAHDVPRIDPDWLEAERRRIPAAMFAQEYLCTFGELEDAVFSHDDIQAMRSADVVPLFAGGAMLSARFTGETS